MTNQAEYYQPYLPQQKFLDAGATHNQRLFLAGNRTGKTYTGSVEVSYHLTGRYPRWWKGKRFDHPVDAWAASVTTQATRDVLQYTYLGDVSILEPNVAGGKLAYGCGSIPKDAIIEWSRARGGVNDAVDVVKVRHVSGGVSTLGFKSYDQGRAKFQGAAKHVIHLDEEPDDVEIYNECAMRLAGKHINGTLLMTMTPLLGMTEVCLKFLQNTDGHLFHCQMGWEDAKHLSEEEKSELLGSMLPHQREAREKGIPAIGAGKVYLTPEADFMVDPFKIPDDWKFCYGMDFGWKNTAAVFLAYNPDTDIAYIYDAYKQGEKEVMYHASVLKRKGANWMPGVCDPAGQASSQQDGQNLIDMYTLEGMNLSKADNSVDSGIMEVYQRLQSGRLKIFSNLADWFAEYRIYGRDKDGKIIKKNDHLLDGTRYVVVSGIPMAKRKPVEKRSDYDFFPERKQSAWAA
jgi:phage terminase large subunit-like protein